MSGSPFKWWDEHSVFMGKMIRYKYH